jgi:hypothetical protein
MTMTDIKKTLLKIMKSHYPSSKYKYYSKEVVEKFDRPCFFTEISIDSSEPASAGADHFLATFSIEILQAVVDEAAALNIGNTLRTAFGRYFMVKDSSSGKERAVKVRNYDFDFIGTDNNVPAIMVTLEWYDRVDKQETADMMEDVDVSLTVQVEE